MRSEGRQGIGVFHNDDLCIFLMTGVFLLLSIPAEKPPVMVGYNASVEGACCIHCTMELRSLACCTVPVPPGPSH